MVGPERRGEFRGVPFGEYLLVVRTSCCRAERRLIANTRDLWVRIGVPLRFGDSVSPGGHLGVEGLLRPRSRVSTRHWVRARGVFLDFSREAPVDSATGKFALEGMDMGTYSIEVFNGATMIHSRLIEIDPRQEVARIVVDIPVSSKP